MAPILPPVWDAILGNLSQSSALLVYGFVDPLQLQTVAFLSAASQVVFFVLQRPPVVIFAFWDSLQALINMIQIIKLVLELAPVKFNEAEITALALMRSSFDAVPSRKIARIFRRCGARWSRHQKGDRLVTFEKGHHDEMILVVEGAVVAYDETGQSAMKIKAGHFLAETALAHAMTDDDTAWLIHDDDDDDPAAHLAYAECQEKTLALRWRAKDLGRALKADKELRDAFRQALAIDLSRKIAQEERSNRRRRSATNVRESSEGTTLYAATLNGGGGPTTKSKRKKSFLAQLFTDYGDEDDDEMDLLEKNAKSLASLKKEATLSRRSRRKRSVMSIMNFVKNDFQKDERSSLVKVAPSETSYKSTTNLDEETKEDVVERPSTASETRRKGRAFLAALGIGFAATLALVAFLYLAIDDPSSTVGNGSQAIVTMAFAITDPFWLMVASCAGTSSQTAFFVFRPPRIWSSIAWSAAQACLTLTMAIYIFITTRRKRMVISDEILEQGNNYTERELFAARCLERRSGVKLGHDMLRDLLHGNDILKPRWRILDQGQSLHDEAYVSLLTDGIVRVTRLHAPSFDASRGALLGGHAVFADSRRPSLVSQTSEDDDFDLDHAVALQGPVELLEWPLDQLKAYLDRHQDPRKIFTILLASHACETYLDVFEIANPPRSTTSTQSPTSDDPLDIDDLRTPTPLNDLTTPTNQKPQHQISPNGLRDALGSTTSLATI